jgi:gliding motility-associated-like protein
VAKPSVTTSYTVVGTDASGCFRDTAHVDVVVGKPSLLSLGADTAVVAGSEISLHAKVSNAPATKYLWSSVERLSCSNCPTPAITIKSDECITCTITNIYGCKTSDTLCVQTFCRNAQVFIPNAFSPDGDGVNDMFYVMGTGIKIVKSFRVFNRWGELVFEKANFAPNNSSTGWDGTIKGQKASGDVYVYICNVVCENDVQYSYKGNVAIIK